MSTRGWDPRKLAIAVFAIGVLATMAALRVVDLRWSRAEALKSAESRAASLAVLLSEYVGETFAAADASLRQLAIDSNRIGGVAAPASAWGPLLASARAGLTSIGAVSVVDRHGIIRQSTRPEIVGQSRRDDYLVRRAFSEPGDDLIIGTPVKGVVAPFSYLIPIGRRVIARDGHVDGILVASYIPAARRGVFRTVDVGSRGAVWVLHPDGVVIFREPSSSDPTGDTVRSSPLFQAAKSGRDGILRGSVSPGGPFELTSYHTSSAAGLIVAVSLDRDEVLAEWRHEVVVSAEVMTAIAITLAVTLVVLFRQMDAKTEAELALARTRQLEAEHLREANDRLAAALDREQVARREVESASALKDQFLMTVSHELRTPLTAIYGWARMLNQNIVSDSRRAVALQAIERNAEAQTRLIDDLLDVSRAIAGTLRIDVAPVDVVEAVQQAVETVSPAAQAKSIGLETMFDPDVGTIGADRQRLQQVVWNLLSNAVKFTRPGGRVTISVVRDHDDVVLTVTDSGIGIRPEFLPHVFERFRQEDAGTTRHHGGLGLGLAIARNLVELHGGSIFAHSDGENRGARFTIRLPARREAPVRAMAPHTVPAPASFNQRLDNLHILVVEDDGAARELFVEILEGAGARVTSASSADDALRAVEANAFDVLLSDIEMPDVDGYDLLRRVGPMPSSRGGRMAAIAVSAYARSEDAVRSIRAGFDRHVSKPVDPAVLVATIADVTGAPRRPAQVSDAKL